MRKLSILSIAIVLVLALSVSCDIPLPEPQETHTHTWDDGYYTVMPTCQEDGEKICTCTTCYETKKEVVKASPLYHLLDNGIETVPATCTEKGERLCTCSRCGAQMTFETDPLDHLWDDGVVTTPSTLTEEGEKTYTCQREGCGATKKEPYHDHVWGTMVVTHEATCSEAGEKQYTCSICGETTLVPVPADGTSHTFNTTWTSDETHHWHSASCSHTVPGAQCDGYAEHTFGDAVVTSPATCTTEGTREKTCTVCGYKAVENFLAEDAHTFEESWTSGENGHWHNASCGHTATTAVEPHTYGDSVEITAGSCTQDGVERYTCTVCGYEHDEAIPRIEYHDINASTHTCNTCGEKFYYQGEFSANKVKVNLRSDFKSASLPELVVPEYVWTWDYYRYYRIEIIQSVTNASTQTLTISEGATTIGYQAFKDKTNLHTVNLPSTLTTIEQESFKNSGLTEIHIPASVTFIGKGAFSDCANLTDVYYAGTSDQWSTLISGMKALQGTTATMHYQSN